MNLLLIAIILVVFGILISRSTYGKIITPLGLFSLCWLLVLGVHYLKIVDYYDLSSSATWCVIVMMLGFVVGCYLAKSRMGLHSIDHSVNDFPLHVYERYTKILKVFCALGLFGFSLFLILKPVNPDAAIGVDRLSRHGDELYRPVRDIIYKLSLPCLFTTTLVSLTLHGRLIAEIGKMEMDISYAAKKVSKAMCILSVLSGGSLVLYDILTLGRIYIVAIFTLFISSYFHTTLAIRMSFKNVILFFCIILAVVSLFKIVCDRREIREGMAESAINYYSGALAYFNSAKDDIHKFTLGRMCFGAFETFFWRPYDYVPVIRNFIPASPELLEDRYVAIFIGPDRKYNAFGTLMLDAYYDAGITGVIMLSFALGYMSTYFYLKSRFTSNPITLCMCTLSGIWILWSPLCWLGGFSFAGTSIFFVLIADYLAMRTKPTRLRILQHT